MLTSSTKLSPVPDFYVDAPEQADTNIGVGDRVRSYDTEYLDHAYIEGTIIAIGEILEGCPRYKVATERVVVDHNDVPFTKPVFHFPPMNGTPTIFGHYCNGVRKL